jgi:hypothetical protein
MQTERPVLTMSIMGRTFLVTSIPWSERGSATNHASTNVSFARERLLADLMQTARSEGAFHAWNLNPTLRGSRRLGLFYDTMGKPHLHGQDSSGPCISFSYGGDRFWAALGGCSTQIGLDVADPLDFRGNYPFSRVFLDTDWTMIPSRFGLQRETADAAAFVWCIKEAAVKAIGCGFHWFGPWETAIEQGPDIAREDHFEVVFYPSHEELERALRRVRVVVSTWCAGRFRLALASCDRRSVEPFRQLLFARMANIS